MSISSREDANKYYQVVNKLIDNYIEEHSIRPSKLRNYLKNGSDKFEKFVNRNGLKDISGINQILTDVIDDRVHMEKDGVLTFENFKFFESDEFKVLSLTQCLYKGIGKSDIKTEKFIADHFDVNLSDIDIIDSDKHLFKVKGWKDENTLIVYNNDEFDIIQKNIKEYLLNEFLKKEIELVGITIKLENVVDNKKFEDQLESLLNEDNIIDLITKSIEKDGDFKFEKGNEYYLWID
jgi:hypothetical protein